MDIPEIPADLITREQQRTAALQELLTRTSTIELGAFRWRSAVNEVGAGGLGLREQWQACHQPPIGP